MKDAKCVLSELELLKKFCEDNISEAINVTVCRVFEGCRVAVVDAIKLIEEQEERIAIMTESKPEVVMCKDCKHYCATPGYCAYDRIWQKNKGHIWGMYCKPDWFCADGERGDKKA